MTNESEKPMLADYKDSCSWVMCAFNLMAGGLIAVQEELAFNDRINNKLDCILSDMAEVMTIIQNAKP